MKKSNKNPYGKTKSAYSNNNSFYNKNPNKEMFDKSNKVNKFERKANNNIYDRDNLK